MARINMVNSENSMDPRISFSNDFADTNQAIKQELKYREAPVSGDFEFSVRNYNMIPADEIFRKGMLLPLKDNYSHQLHKLTLREELLAKDDYLPKLPRSSGWWKDKFGLKKSQGLCKKGGRDIILDKKAAVSVNEERRGGKTIQELLCE